MKSRSRPHTPVGRLDWLAERCLTEPPSRRLDGEICCVVHDVEDANDLSNERSIWARENGEVLVKNHRGAGMSWIEAPPFTTELKYAESLLPKGLLTICRDARIVCATALNARARTGAPPSLLSDIFEYCRR